MLNLEHTTIYLPPTIGNLTTSHQAIGISKLHAKIYSTYYGLEEVPVANEISMQEFLKQPLLKLLAYPALKHRDISYIIYTHTVAPNVIHAQSVLQYLKNYFKLNHANAFAITMSKCASFLDAIDIANHLIANTSSEKIIILTGDKAFMPELRALQNASITGDAAAAVLVSKNNVGAQLIAQSKKIYGKFARGGWSNPEETLSFERDFITLLVAVIHDVLKKAALTLDNIKIILPHNVNIPIWTQTAKALGISFDKIYSKNIKKTSHCFTSDFLLNYHDMCKENLLAKDDYFLAVNVGFGLTLHAAIFQH